MTANTTLDAAPRRAPAGSIVLIVIGSVLTLLGFSILSAGILTAGVAAAQGAHGFLTSQNTVFATDTYALTTPRTAIT